MFGKTIFPRLSFKGKLETDRVPFISVFVFKGLGSFDPLSSNT
jgi:hypothetical protein